MRFTSRRELEPFFYGHIDFEETTIGLRPLRLPLETKVFTAPGLWGRAENCAGIRLALSTDATKLRMRLRLDAQEDPTKVRPFIQTVVSGKITESVMPLISPESQEVEFNVPRDPEVPIEIYLPVAVSMTLESIELINATFVRPVPDERCRWVTYGSSITQAGASHGPAQTWPVLAARELDWNLTCLGYGGNCQFDQVVARAIAKRKWDRISLCLGVNTWAGVFSERSWGPAVEGFIFTVRDKHPEIPLLIISPICSTPREIEDNLPERMGLPVMRRTLEKIVAKFKGIGDRHIHYLNGLDFMGPDDMAFFPDQLHPNAEGYELMGQRFPKVAPKRWREGLPSEA